MPPKRMKKRKGMEQERGKAQPNKKQKLSKAQKRKPKKSEDDKEKQILLQKALKTLNENTLPVYAYPLLQSSSNINRLRKEGRRNEYEKHKLQALNQRQKMEYIQFCKLHSIRSIRLDKALPSTLA